MVVVLVFISIIFSPLKIVLLLIFWQTLFFMKYLMFSGYFFYKMNYLTSATVNSIYIYIPVYIIYSMVLKKIHFLIQSLFFIKYNSNQAVFNFGLLFLNMSPLNVLYSCLVRSYFIKKRRDNIFRKFAV